MYAKHFDEVSETIIDRNMCTETCPCNNYESAKSAYEMMSRW